MASAAAESYQVIARKYRPQTFDEVVGQGHVSQTLQNAIREERIGHAYLFTGARGVGKTSMARILAKALNCQKGPTPEPCGKCDACTGIVRGGYPDVLEIDGASNALVDDIRILRENAGYVPLRGRYKVYIIDEVHMLSKSAFNALLKTLEEPPPHCKFIFATTEPHKLPETILSRCQKLDFRAITHADIVTALRGICKREGAKANDRVLGLIARAARGSMRDGQTLLEQIISTAAGALEEERVSALLGTVGPELLFALFDAVHAQDPAAALKTIDRVYASGRDPAVFLEQVLQHARDLMVTAACGPDSGLVDATGEDLAAYAAQAKKFTVESLLYAMSLTADARRRLRDLVNSRIIVELLAVKLARAGDLVHLGEALARLDGAAPTSAMPVRDGSAGAPTLTRPPPAPSPLDAGFARQVREPAGRDEHRAAPTTASSRGRANDDRDSAADAPEEEPEASPRPAVTGALTIDSLRANWDRVLAAVQKRRATVAAVLREGAPVKVDEDSVTIGFDPVFSFHMEQLSDPERRQVVEAGLADVFGRPMALQIAAEASGGASAHASPASPAKEDSRIDHAPALERRKGTDLSQDPRVRKLQERFGGRVLPKEGR